MSRLIRVAEAVALTGLSERILRQAIADGRLAVVRPVGVRVVLIPEAALAVFTGAPLRSGREDNGLSGRPDDQARHPDP